jgi:hypothetical protein
MSSVSNQRLEFRELKEKDMFMLLLLNNYVNQGCGSGFNYFFGSGSVFGIRNPENGSGSRGNKIKKKNYL